MRRRRKVLAGIVVALGLVACLGPWVVRVTVGPVVVYNATASLPKGWYVRAWHSFPLQVGDIVVMEVPAAVWAQIPAELPVQWFLKHVAALPGMQVCWTAEGMEVRYEQMVVTYRLHAEYTGLSPAVVCRVLTEEEIVVTGEHERSLDSRYMGPLAFASVQWRALPLWTWRGTE
jgi:type IV secretory pathway protease TraF